jgi:tetratricopeptide (TPR) repeat protein
VANDSRSVAWTSYWLGIVDQNRGRIADARSWLDRAQLVFAELSERAAVASCLREKADLLRQQGELDEAAALCVRALATHRELGDRSGELSDLRRLGMITGESDPAHGIALLERARRRAGEQGRPPVVARIAKSIEELRRRLPADGAHG